MKYVRGNLLDLFDAGEFDMIIHGCNCRGIMGAGIAKQIADRYPIVAKADRELSLNRMMNDPKMFLGTYNYIDIGNDKLKIVVNAYTQVNPGPCASLHAIGDVFFDINFHAKNEGCVFGKLKIGIPMIGAGLGGLDWNDVVKVIDENSSHLDITTVIYDGGK